MVRVDGAWKPAEAVRDPRAPIWPSATSIRGFLPELGRFQAGGDGAGGAGNTSCTAHTSLSSQGVGWGEVAQKKTRKQNGGRGVFSDGPMRAEARNGSGRKNLLSAGGARVVSSWSACRLSAKRRRRPSGELRPCCWPWLAAPTAHAGADGSRLECEGCAPTPAHPECDPGQPGQGRDRTSGWQ